MAESVKYHWLATIQIDGQQITREGTIPAVPGVHTRQSTTLAVIKGLQEDHGEGFVVLFFSLEPNELPGAGGR